MADDEDGWRHHDISKLAFGAPYGDVTDVTDSTSWAKGFGREKGNL